MAPILDTLPESEPLFTGDRRADYVLYTCFNCTQATSLARCKSHTPVNSPSTKEQSLGMGGKGKGGPGGGGGGKRGGKGGGGIMM